jgi:hypothetical protein
MQKALILFILILALPLTNIFAEHIETYFSFEIKSRDEIGKLTRIISIDNVKVSTVYAYANEKELKAFEELGYQYTVLPHPGTLIIPEMAFTKDAMKDWDYYPTYDAYITMMNNFAANFPNLCVIVSAGNSVQGRNILFAKISDNVNTEEDEPEVLYTSSMHGDETTGYVLMLRLIDYLLNNYGTDSMATRLVNNCEIWINPLANPDGTYAGGNSTVYNATRYNANGIDINRNFPDPEDGSHPDGNSWQAETNAMMNLAAAHSFCISANFHGGAEVVNYPWDTWATRHADDQWYIDISRAYADTVHIYAGSSYMNDLNNGITNGYDWYEVNGGRQDYMNWWYGCREVTIEISSVKLLPAGQLPAHWNYNRVSLLNWLENALYGIRGIVTDASTGLPIFAQIKIIGHDIDNSEVYTDPDVGDYHRMIHSGTYNVQFSADGYFSDTIFSVSVTNNNATEVDVALQPLPNEPVFAFDSHTASASNPGDTVAMKITLTNNGGGNAYNTSATLFTNDPLITVSQSYSTYPTISALGGEGTSISDYIFDISPSCTTFHVIDFDLFINSNGSQYDTVNFSYMVGDRVIFFTENFSFNQGWTGTGGSGEWTIGIATGGSGNDSYGNADPSQDHSTSADNYLLGNDLTSGTGGDYNSSLSSTYWVTSPLIDCSNFNGVELRFWRWLGIESGSYDHAYLQVNDGSSWTTIFQNSSTLNESSWNQMYYDVSQYADSNPNLQIRFGIGTTDGSAQYCGWNIDDIELKGYGKTASGNPNVAYTPLSIADSLQSGGIGYDTIVVNNTGETLLRIRFSSVNSWLALDTAQKSIAAGDSLLFIVAVNSTGMALGNHYGAISFTSNDPDTPNGTISVSLHIFMPNIYIAEDSLNSSLATGEQTTMPLLIENSGPGILSYQVSRQMFNGKILNAITSDYLEPIGYRMGDQEKSPLDEPFFAAVIRDNGGPDSWGHSWIDSDDPMGPVYSWIDISTVGTELVGLGDDDTSAALNIGFSFPFYENSYTKLYIASNGIITLGAPSTSRSNVNLPNATTPNNLISIWWDDLDPRKGGHIYYYYDAANNRFIASFVDIRNYYSTTGTGSLTFQAILYPDGKIILQYGVMNPGSDADGLNGATIGIENSTGSDGLTVVYNAAYMHDNLAIQIAAPNWLTATPSSGQIQPYSSATVQIGFDATEMDEGLYTGRITVASNDPDTPSWNIAASMNVGPAYVCGDANRSGVVNIQDVTYVINFLYKGGPSPNPVGAADANGSGTVNIQDVTYIINFLYKGGPTPICP